MFDLIADAGAHRHADLGGDDPDRHRTPVEGVPHRIDHPGAGGIGNAVGGELRRDEQRRLVETPDHSGLAVHPAVVVGGAWRPAATLAEAGRQHAIAGGLMGRV